MDYVVVEEDTLAIIPKSLSFAEKNIFETGLPGEVNKKRVMSEINLVVEIWFDYICQFYYIGRKKGHLTGVQGISHFLFNKTYTVSGAQDVFVYKEALNKA
ncbi:hypothetical protein [Clostridium intestinale]|uniref:Uncharacterized protein n=1 Tax=Clostridium intestinale DSM 6191 TaxID=1121320 RepID=A0A1M5YLN2_9CLOT|nr:hypothetical protein [Clostridium intestinale]SHI12754.1 hypothetical protein SAMN02745941_02113 [Clostridium intestinale DSM 6191]